MKLQNKKNKLLSIVVIVVAVVIVLGLIVAGILIFGGSDEEYQPTDILGISMSSYPRREYYIGEEFDPTGTEIQVLTYDSSNTYFANESNVSVSGFDSSTPVEEQVITVSYKGFTTTFTVTIKEMPKDSPTAETIEIFDFKTTITMSDWNEFGPISLIRGSTLKIVYSDGTMGDPVYVDPSWVWGYQKVSQPGTFDLTIKYNNDGTLYEKVVTITITN